MLIINFTFDSESNWCFHVHFVDCFFSSTANTVSVHSVIYSLLVFLSALPEPVVPFAFQSNCIAAARQATPNNVISAYQAISRLPIDYQNLFFYLVSFIKRCLSHGNENGTNVEMLGKGALVACSELIGLLFWPINCVV